MILLSIIFMDILTGMEFDLFVPSFPKLQAYFGISPFWVEASLSVNFIGFCISLFFVGTLADRYGRRPFIIIGLLLFLLGTLFCLGIPEYPIFLLGRFLQGVGIAAPAILSFLIIADRYPIKEQSFFLAMLNGSMNIAVAIAPVMGSYLTLYFNWQGNFMALLILGALVLLMTLIFIPKDQLFHNENAHFLKGYGDVFKSKPLILMALTLFILFVPYWIFVGMSPLLYMQDLRVSLSHFGYYQGVLAFAFAIGSVIFGFIMKYTHFTQRTWLNTANAILLLSVLALLGVVILAEHSPLLITAAMLVFVVAQIIPSTILYPLCLEKMPAAKGQVSAIIQGGRLIFSAVGLQMASYFYQGSFQSIGVLLLIFIGFGIIGLIRIAQSGISEKLG